MIFDVAFLLHLNCIYLNIFPVGQEKRDHSVLRRVSVNTDIVNHGNNFEVGLNLSQGDVFACLQLDEVLFPIDYLNSATLQNLPDVSGLEYTGYQKMLRKIESPVASHLKKAHAVLLVELFFGFVWHQVVAGGDVLPADHDLTSGPLGVLDSVAALVPIRNLNGN